MRTDPLEPSVWLVDTTKKIDGVLGLARRLTHALHVIEKTKTPSLNGRSRALIAMPLVGIGAGGYKSDHAQAISSLMGALLHFCSRDDAPDVVLVVQHRSDYAVLQKMRQVQPLPSAQLQAVERMAAIARDGRLLLFLGAGVSQAAGLPSWGRLLRELLEHSSIPSSEYASILHLPAPDAAACISADLGPEALTASLRGALPSKRYALAHGLLASMKVSEVVTTNYDSLFEDACRVPWADELTVLPEQRLNRSGPWLLKLHGDLKDPESIVLTREQYLTFENDAAPLASIVQAGMVTKHVLFCGYSLSDDNFIRLARQVRDVLRRGKDPSAKVGTVLTLFREAGRERLWSDDVDFVAATNETAPGLSKDDVVSTSAAARQLEILLDVLAHRACSEASYLLDPKYRSLLSASEQALAEALSQVRPEMCEKGSSAGDKVRELLQELGHRP